MDSVSGQNMTADQERQEDREDETEEDHRCELGGKCPQCNEASRDYKYDHSNEEVLEDVEINGEALSDIGEDPPENTSIFQVLKKSF